MSQTRKENLKIYVMVLMALGEIILILSFYLCVIAYYYASDEFVMIFGLYKVHPLFLADLSFTLAMIVQIALIIVIMSQFKRNP